MIIDLVSFEFGLCVWPWLFLFVGGSYFIYKAIKTPQYIPPPQQPYGYQQTSTYYPPSGQGYQQTTTSYQQTIPGYQPQATTYAPTTPGYQSPAPSYTQSTPYYQQSQPQQQNNCPYCHLPLYYSHQQHKWYCTKCNKYY